MSVKVYPDSLRFARVIREKPILSNVHFCADMLGMTAYNAYNGTTIEISNLVRGLNAASSSLQMTNRP